MTYEQYIELEDLYREAQLGYDFIHTDFVNKEMLALVLSDDNVDLEDSLGAFEDDGNGTYYPGLIMVPAHTVLRTDDYELAKGLVQTIKTFKHTS